MVIRDLRFVSVEVDNEEGVVFRQDEANIARSGLRRLLECHPAIGISHGRGPSHERIERALWTAAIVFRAANAPLWALLHFFGGVLPKLTAVVGAHLSRPHCREGRRPCFSLVQCNSARSTKFDDGEGPSVGQPINSGATTLESITKLIEGDELHFLPSTRRVAYGGAVMAHFYFGHGGNATSLFCPRN